MRASLGPPFSHPHARRRRSERRAIVDAISLRPRPTRTDAQTIASSPTIRDYRARRLLLLIMRCDAWIDADRFLDPVCRKSAGEERRPHRGRSIRRRQQVQRRVSCELIARRPRAVCQLNLAHQVDHAVANIQVESRRTLPLQSPDLRSARGPGPRGCLQHDSNMSTVRSKSSALVARCDFISSLVSQRRQLSQELSFSLERACDQRLELVFNGQRGSVAASGLLRS